MYKIIIIINLKTSFNMKVDFSLQNDLESTNIVNVHQSNKLSSFRHQLNKSSLFIKRTNNIFQTNCILCSYKGKIYILSCVFIKIFCLYRENIHFSKIYNKNENKIDGKKSCGEERIEKKPCFGTLYLMSNYSMIRLI